MCFGGTHSRLYLVIASCHNVGDGFQYVGPAHVLNHLSQTTKKKGWVYGAGQEEEKQDANKKDQSWSVASSSSFSHM